MSLRTYSPPAVLEEQPSNKKNKGPFRAQMTKISNLIAQDGICPTLSRKDGFSLNGL